MSIKYVLFDLDGTLLPMDQQVFLQSYISLLTKKMEPYGYDRAILASTIWKSSAAMVNNDGSRSNEDAFWDTFDKTFPGRREKDEPVFNSFYQNEFQSVSAVCSPTPRAAEAISFFRDRGIIPVLATNPVFPAVATEKRIGWAGLTVSDFAFFTSFEGSSYCKPNPKYYQQILDRLGATAKECLMVGNDVTEDMVAATLGMKVFLLTDCLINTSSDDISKYPHGSFDGLIAYAESLIDNTK